MESLDQQGQLQLLIAVSFQHFLKVLAVVAEVTRQFAQLV